jgi:hypothetical protein
VPNDTELALTIIDEYIRYPAANAEASASDTASG